MNNQKLFLKHSNIMAAPCSYWESTGYKSQEDCIQYEKVQRAKREFTGFKSQYKFIAPHDTGEICIKMEGLPADIPDWMASISTSFRRKCLETKRMVFEVGDIITGTTYFAGDENVRININGVQAVVPLSKLVKITSGQNGKSQSSFLVWVIIAIIAFLIFTNNQKTQI